MPCSFPSSVCEAFHEASRWRALRQGIAGHGFFDTCVVPIIENTARECELTGRLREAIAAYPRANAVLVRRHGVYVWGANWLQVRFSAMYMRPVHDEQLLSMRIPGT